MLSEQAFQACYAIPGTVKNDSMDGPAPANPTDKIPPDTLKKMEELFRENMQLKAQAVRWDQWISLALAL